MTWAIFRRLESSKKAEFELVDMVDGVREIHKAVRGYARANALSFTPVFLHKSRSKDGTTTTYYQGGGFVYGVIKATPEMIRAYIEKNQRDEGKEK